MFPKDVIGSLAKIKKSVQILRGETSDHIFSHTIESLSLGFVNWNGLVQIFQVQTKCFSCGMMCLRAKQLFNFLTPLFHAWM